MPASPQAATPGEFFTKSQIDMSHAGAQNACLWGEIFSYQATNENDFKLVVLHIKLSHSQR